jgi:hypothetical protein
VGAGAEWLLPSRAAKTLSFRLTEVLPHLGQDGIRRRLPDGASSSNSLLQEVQTYSYSGMAV